MSDTMEKYNKFVALSDEKLKEDMVLDGFGVESYTNHVGSSRTIKVTIDFETTISDQHLEHEKKLINAIKEVLSKYTNWEQIEEEIEEEG